MPTRSCISATRRSCSASRAALTHRAAVARCTPYSTPMRSMTETLALLEAARAQVARDDPHSFRLKTIDQTIETWEAALARRQPPP